MKRIKLKSTQIGDLIYQEDLQDPFGNSYFTMLVIDKKDDVVIIKDYSRNGKIIEVKKDSYFFFSDDNDSMIIHNKVLQDQKALIRDHKIDTITQ